MKSNSGNPRILLKINGFVPKAHPQKQERNRVIHSTLLNHQTRKYVTNSFKAKTLIEI